MQLPKTKILDMSDLKDPALNRINNLFNSYFGKNWPQVPLRRWEYVCAIAFSEIREKPGKCLDAGSGESVFSRFLEKIGCEVCCIDIRATERTQGRIRHYKMSMHDMSFEDEIFNYVFAISSIEHVNAGRFGIKGMKSDEGDTAAFFELLRVLKSGGKLILTTDFADKYYPPPGLWPSGSHRIYDKDAIMTRLINPALFEAGYQIRMRPINSIFVPENLRELEPKGYDYTDIILTIEKETAQ